MRTLIAFFLLSVSVVAQTEPVGLREPLSVKDYGAKGDGSNDDTTAIQMCIDYSAGNRASCFVPPGTYKITGDGLHMTVGQPSLYGLQSEGNGSASFVYYG